jgi:hypothetical protein
MSWPRFLPDNFILARRKSIGGAEVAKDAKPAKKPRKVASGQKEMLMPIADKKPAKEAAAKKPAAKPQRKSALVLLILAGIVTAWHFVS